MKSREKLYSDEARFKLIHASQDNLKFDKLYKKTSMKYIQFGKFDQKTLFFMWFFDLIIKSPYEK